MYSKRLLMKTFLLLAMGLSAGCSEFLAGEKDKKEVIEISDNKFACLNDIPQTIRDFSEGKAKDSAIEGSIVCTQEALLYFQRRTEGASSESYTAAELRSFFGKYFLKENNVSPQFSQELMHLKAALLGGSANYLTKVEISRLVFILKIFKEELLKINSQIAYLTFQLPRKTLISEQQQRASRQVLEESLIRLIKETEITKSNYTFSDAKKLFAAVAEFVSGNEPFNLYLRASSYLPLVENAKKVIFGEKADLRTHQDWAEAISSVVKFYGISLSFYYQYEGLEISSADQLKRYLKVGDEVIDAILSSPSLKQNRDISTELLDELFVHLKGLGLIPSEIRSDTLHESYRVILGRFLDANKFNDLGEIHFLKRSHILTLKREFEVFKMRQEIFHSQYQEGMTLSDFVEKTKKINIDRWLRLQEGLDVSLKANLRKSWSDTLLLLTQNPAIIFSNVNRVIISREVKDQVLSWRGMTQINVMMTLSRFLMLGYGTGNSLTLDRSAISESGLMQWYSDFNSLGLDLKAFDPRSLNPGGRSFKEANFFTYRGNGDNRMDISESFEFVSFLFSGGMGSSGNLQKTLELEKCEVSQLDVFGFKMFEEECFKRVLFSRFDTLFNNLAGMSSYVKGLNTSARNEFYSLLISASRVSEARGNIVEVSDIRTMVMLLHYIDSVFAIYDVNQDGVLNRAEVKKASSRFISFLRDIRPGVSDSNLEDAFYHMVFIGEIPDAWDVVGSKLGRWFNTDRTADRLNILKVISALKSNLNSPEESGRQ